MDLLRILSLWRGRAGWLAAGLLISLAALACGVALMAMSGAMIGTAVAAGVLLAPVALRGLGGARVALRYLERLVTHAATFRALADLRVWFFRHLARTAAGGLGFRHAGDVLARLVGDVEALDGLYLRILVPLAGAVLLLPVLLVVIGRHEAGLALAVALLFAAAALLLPWLAARAALESGGRLTTAASALRIAALDALTGLREVRAFGAEGRMVAAVQARESALLAAQHDLARRTALAGAGAFLCWRPAPIRSAPSPQPSW
jgi:ATP-binding cassette subfamily C protein CydC